MAAPSAKWSKIPSMKLARGNVPSIVHDEKIYVFGGSGPNIAVPLDNVEVYDPNDKIWTSLPNIPRKRSNITLVCIDQKILLIGGYTTKGVAVTEIDVFDTSTHSWELYPSMKTSSTMYPIVVLVEKDVYILGGANQFGVAITDCFVLKHGEKDWQQIASLSTARYHAKAYHFENTITIIGGRSGKEAVMSVDTYDIRNNTWTLKKFSPIPAKRVFCSSIQHGENVYVTNGLNPPVDFKTNAEVYNLKKKKWEMILPCPFARADTSVCLVEEKYLISVSGMCEYGPNQVTELYDISSNKWFSLPEMPTPRISVSAVALNNTVVVLGGVGLKGPCDAVECLTMNKSI